MPRKILLADDSVTAQNMGRKILSDAGYAVILVNNGSAALKKIAEEKPDIAILDVYMPGYSGLEVCQRLKEARETAHLPVLLSVGKLEPFKPDEARRVQADAHIVKPFEASELLAALTKLENKIVPQEEPVSASRFATAIARAEKFTVVRDQDDEFRPPDPGWKRRGAGGESKTEVRQDKGTAFRDLGREEKPKSGKSKTTPEIATLPVVVAQVTSDQETSGTAVAPVLDSQPAPLKPEFSVTPTAAGDSWNSPFAAVPEAPSAQAEPETRLTSDVELASAAKSEAAISMPLPAEVIAALASLSPSYDDGVLGPRSRIPGAELATASEYAGSRWIAAEVPVTESESAFLLEREMEKAHAGGPVGEDFRAADAQMEALISTLGGDRSAITKPEWTPPTSKSRAATPPNFKPEPAAMAVAEPKKLDAPVATADARASAVEAVPKPSVGSKPVIAAKEETAHAAAAAASFGISETTVPGRPSIQAAAPKPVPESEAGARSHEAEMAAAWANWKQIRETMVGAGLPADLADAAAAGFKSIRPEGPNSQPQAISSAAAPADSNAIASIVDTMLAELRPKLVEEIAKKLAAEPKK